MILNLVSIQAVREGRYISTKFSTCKCELISRINRNFWILDSRIIFAQFAIYENQYMNINTHKKNVSTNT